MIRINLAKQKQASYVAASRTNVTRTSVTKSIGSGLVENLSGVLFKMLVPVILSMGCYFGFEYYTTHLNADMTVEVTQLETEKTKIETELSRIKGFDSTKAELEKTEKILHAKIDTIQKLIQGRDFAFKSMVSLSQSLPHEVWLSEFSQGEQLFSIKGNATDLGLVSDLMTKLGQTIYFKDITLKSTSNDAASAKAVFELTARRE